MSGSDTSEFLVPELGVNTGEGVVGSGELDDDYLAAQTWHHELLDLTDAAAVAAVPASTDGTAPPPEPSHPPPSPPAAAATQTVVATVVPAPAAAPAAVPKWEESVQELSPQQAQSLCGGDEIGAVERLVCAIRQKGDSVYMCRTFTPEYAKMVLDDITLDDNMAVATCLYTEPKPEKLVQGKDYMSGSMGLSGRDVFRLHKGDGVVHYCFACEEWVGGKFSCKQDHIKGNHRQKVEDLAFKEGQETQQRRSKKVWNKNSALNRQVGDGLRDAFDLHSHTTSDWGPESHSCEGVPPQARTKQRARRGPGSDEVRVDERGQIHPRSEGSDNSAETARACRPFQGGLLAEAEGAAVGSNVELRERVITQAMSQAPSDEMAYIQRRIGSTDPEDNSLPEVRELAAKYAAEYAAKSDFDRMMKFSNTKAHIMEQRVDEIRNGYCAWMTAREMHQLILDGKVADAWDRALLDGRAQAHNDRQRAAGAILRQFDPQALADPNHPGHASAVAAANFDKVCAVMEDY
jgi:hypothetical protein